MLGRFDASPFHGVRVTRAPEGRSSTFGLFRSRSFVVFDIVSLAVALLAAYLLRFEGWSWREGEGNVALVYVACALPLRIVLLTVLGMYRRLWRYAGTADVEAVLVAAAGSALIGMVIGGLILPATGLLPYRVPYSVLLLDGLIGGVLLAFPRLGVRVWASRRRQGTHDGVVRRALIAGAGSAGGTIVKELLENPQLGIVPVGFLDDDPLKVGKRLHGVPVLGSLAEVETLAPKMNVAEIIIALPTAPGRVVRDVLQSAHRAGIPTRTVPGIWEILSGRKAVSALRKVEIQDLLRRPPVDFTMHDVRRLATGRTVLVTGAGGSIGSELCRQLARIGPARIVAVGRGENSIFELLEGLAQLAPDVPVEPVIADVRDLERMRAVFAEFRPHAVFHAAAYKHVPLMEKQAAEAVLNNVLGTRNVVTLAGEMGTEHFVLISTDKAVHPTSVMGATKRLAEGIVFAEARRTGKRFMSVRFGNVLGSRGSVVPIFLRQIAEGGPVTVTHPEMRRYFMTIPEAVRLVLQAGSMGAGGEVFVLDMGEPVRIVDLATDLIRLSGLEVGTDIEIRFDGMRPGEKLNEELFNGGERPMPTAHPKILRASGVDTHAPDPEALDTLLDAARANHSSDELRAIIAAMVPEYRPTHPRRGTQSGQGPVVRPDYDPTSRPGRFSRGQTP
jgi:FlaA1/EpsC-like NDP-sugar epimerase